MTGSARTRVQVLGPFLAHPRLLSILGALMLAGRTEGQDAPVSELSREKPTLVLRAEWSPLARSTYELQKSSAKLSKLLAPEPAELRHAYETVEFRPLLPAAGVNVGDVWRLDPKALLPFLRQLHPGARTEMHHAPTGIGGAYACLLASTPERLEVLVRLHAEFEFERAKVFFTPAQFEGRLTWDRKADRPLLFTLAVPARDPNVDINAWDESYKGMVADIGFVPSLGLRSEMPAIASPGLPEQLVPKHLVEDARAKLRCAFYPCSRLPWLSLEEGLAVAREEGKPLHVVILFGTLDDESC